jgi:hypothetical protein
VRTIYDPYIFGNNTAMINPTLSKIRAGVIGRVTATKGLKELESFCDFLEENKASSIEIHLFGDIEEMGSVSRFVTKSKSYKLVKVIFHGFIQDKNTLYGSIDIVLHFSMVEALGRIFFESLDHGLPFIGFNGGGIGEIAKLLLLEDCMVNYKPDWPKDLYGKIMNIGRSTHKYQFAKNNCLHHFSASAYCKSLEEVILRA